MVLHDATLVLNRNWTPVDFTTVLDALCKLYTGSARAVSVGSVNRSRRILIVRALGPCPIAEGELRRMVAAYPDRSGYAPILAAWQEDRGPSRQP